MLRITSKKVRDAVDKLCPPTHVKLCATFLHNAVNFTSAFYYTVDATQRSALKRERVRHIITQLDSWEKMISHDITKINLNHCDMSDHEAWFLVEVHNEIGAEGADFLNELGLGHRKNWEFYGEKFEGYGMIRLQNCWSSAQGLLTSISATIRLEQPGHGKL